MKIVNGPIGKKGKLLTRIDVYASVKEVALIEKKVARNVICGYVEKKPLYQHLSRYYVFPPRCRVYLQYLLSVTVELVVDACVSIGELLWEIAQAYKEIYEEEKRTSKIKIVPLRERKVCRNRNRTDGNYGVFGHDIGDLEFETITVYDNGVIAVGIGS